jgi:hypothetical protein
MRKIFFVIIFALFAAAVSAQIANDGARYTRNSVLRTGKWIKIAVSNSGIYKLTYENLAAMGINPSNVRIFGYGGALLPETFKSPYIDDLPEVAIYMNKGADGVFNAGDYILFYAQGVVSWTYGNPPSTASPMFYHTLNHYSVKGYYFVTSDAGTGKKISMREVESETYNGDITEFMHYDVHETDLQNIAGGGREFYGESFTASAPSQICKFFMPNLLTKSAKLRVKAANLSSGGAVNIAITMNNQNVGTMTIDKITRQGNTGEDKKSMFNFTPSAAQTDTTYIKLTSTPATAILDFVELNVRRRLKIVNNQFYFRNIDYLNQEQFRRFIVTNSEASTQIWDITDNQNIKQIPAKRSNDTLTFVAGVKTLRQYLAVKPTANFPVPEIIGEVGNQNLHSFTQPDFVIIANSDFLGEAERLAQAHRQKDGMRVHVVDAQKVYNEFSSGTPDATAYRRFVKMFYDRAVSDASGSQKMPKYLLLFGDGSFDNRGLLNNTSEPIRRLLTFQAVNSVSGTDSYVSDDYFGYMDDDSGAMLTTHILEIGVGRFPVYLLEQAKTLVDKTIHYMNNEIRGNWKNQVLFVADDGNSGEHANFSDSVTRIIANANKEILVRKLYADAYKQTSSAGGDRYPAVETLLDNYIKSGVLIINYMGHGSSNNLGGEQYLTKYKIDNMYNEKYPVFVTATCDFTGYDQFSESAGEKLLWHKNGGTMALFTTTRTVFSNSNFVLNCYFANNAFLKDEDCNPPALGDIIKKAKNMQKNTNKFAFALVGDPALTLAYPHQGNVVTDSIDFKHINSLAFDTISALGKVHISGHIENC